MLQFTGSQRVRHDLATEQQQAKGHWDGEEEDAPSRTWSPGWGLGFRTSKPPVPPSSGLDSQSWEEPKGGDSVWGRSLAVPSWPGLPDLCSWLWKHECGWGWRVGRTSPFFFEKEVKALQQLPSLHFFPAVFSHTEAYTIFQEHGLDCGGSLPHLPSEAPHHLCQSP